MVFCGVKWGEKPYYSKDTEPLEKSLWKKEQESMELKHSVASIYIKIYLVYSDLSYDVASESVIKPCIKNDNSLVD